MDLAVSWISPQPSDFFQPISEIQGQEYAHMDCFRVLGFTNLILNICLPSFILWMWEIEMRLTFIKKIDADGELRYQNEIIDPTWIPSRFLIFVLLTVSVFVVWRLSAVLEQ